MNILKVKDGDGNWVDIPALKGDTGMPSEQQVQDAVDDYLDGHPAVSGTFTNAAKYALLSLLEKVAYIDTSGQTYLEKLRRTLNPAGAFLCTNVLTGCTSSNDDFVVYEGESYNATITADPGYTLAGATVSVTMGGETVHGAYSNGEIAIASVTGAIVITITAVSLVSSISAVFTQGSAVVSSDDELDSLRPYLEVTATYSDTTTDVVSDYTLSGTLESGTSTVTVSYGGETDTFTVDVAITGWLYHFDQSIISSGSHDFGLTGVENYTDGVNVGDKCYYHHVTTEGDASTDPLGLYALSCTDHPTWGNSDFTIATWWKSDTANRGHMFAAAKRSGSGYISWSATASNIAQGWSVTKYDAGKAYLGIRMGTISEQLSISLTNAAGNAGGRYQFTAPSGFDTTQWHHYALTRSGATLYFFIDGNLICNIVLSATTQIYSSDCITIGNLLNESANTVAAYPFSSYHQDLYINVGTAKWTEDFDPSAISY